MKNIPRIVSFAMLFVVGMFIGIEYWNYIHSNVPLGDFLIDKIGIALPILISSVTLFIVLMHHKKQLS